MWSLPRVTAFLPTPSSIEGHDVLADESLLTGESVPVRKHPVTTIPPERPRPGGDDLPFLYAGSLIVRGTGIARVVATGPRSEIGKIGQSLHELESEPPRLQLQTARLVRFAALGGAIVSIVAVILYGTLRGGWLDAVLAGIAIGMSMLPEEFPVVLTVFMAMGAWRIARARVLTRRAASIETLGSATVLCTDKTGTLTENRMSVVQLRRLDEDLLRFDAWRTRASLPTFRDLALYGYSPVRPSPLTRWRRPFMNLHVSHSRPEMICPGRAGRSLVPTASDQNCWRSPKFGRRIQTQMNSSWLPKAPRRLSLCFPT